MLAAAGVSGREGGALRRIAVSRRGGRAATSSTAPAFALCTSPATRRALTGDLRWLGPRTWPAAPSPASRDHAVCHRQPALLDDPEPAPRASPRAPGLPARQSAMASAPSPTTVAASPTRAPTTGIRASTRRIPQPASSAAHRRRRAGAQHAAPHHPGARRIGDEQHGDRGQQQRDAERDAPELTSASTASGGTPIAIATPLRPWRRGARAPPAPPRTARPAPARRAGRRRSPTRSPASTSRGTTRGASPA